MKAIIEALLPAFIHPKYKDNHRYRKLYTDYASALKQCNRKGYENEAIVEVVYQKTRTYIQKADVRKIGIQELALLQGMIQELLRIPEKRTLKVLDFGGACGLHYFEVRRLLPPEISLQWYVVETTEMVKRGQLLTDFAQGELHFSDDLNAIKQQVGEFDIVHTSGTLQAVPDPWYYLDKLLALNAKTLIFNRLGLIASEQDIFTVHHAKLSWNGKGPLPEGFQDKRISYPFGFFSESRFLKKLAERYEIANQLDDDSGSYPVNGLSVRGYGLCCKRKD